MTYILDACVAVGISLPNIQKLIKTAKHHYAENHRCYHTWKHIEYMLNKMPPDWITPTLVIAIVFHDVIYDLNQCNNNEIASAKFATELLQKLGVDQSTINQIYRLIISTTTGFTQRTLEEKRLSDLDLSILGDAELYDLYAQCVRKEYKKYPKALYAQGRKKVMVMFLQTSEIYKTPEFAHLEQVARNNISKELSSL